MEKFKAEGERDAVKESMEDMAEVIVRLVGMLGRCSVIMGDAAGTLKKDGADGPDTVVVKKTSEMLQSVKQTNDATFKSLLGHSTESYALADTSALNVAVDHFQLYNTSFMKRSSSGPAVLEAANKEKRASRRLSAYGTMPSSPRRTGEVSDKERKGLKVSKNVQWRDEAGGDLVEEQTQRQPQPKVMLSVIPASPSIADTSSTSKPTPSSDDSLSSLPRPSSAMGSESDWEDENEKTDDSFNSSFLPSLPSSREAQSSLSASTSSRPLGIKRPRPSRLDPTFLKSRTKHPGLESLAEDDESGSVLERRSNPLSNMDMNTAEEMDPLHVPKGRHRNDPYGSPTRRAPSSPSKNHLSSSVLGSKRSGAASERRRSNIGVLRLDKPRRRSSLMPGGLDHSYASGSNESISAGPTKSTGARRVLLASPGKRKRPSLTRLALTSTMKKDFGYRFCLIFDCASWWRS
ncbi:hypothetical protein NP233_g2958 [Leucocoprinus birnbaumii]|uniref:Uncharacterized protein n=1 Tax=Leucocoprinus birnbaumii TaxID=56174 RepID=A0AAD5VXG1_9AGAR|nr:hypothetical protein NP233_g2958 [Leucocoprinus birnbaumii]